MIEREIETKLITRLNALSLSDVQIIGSWQTVTNGVKGANDETKKAAIAVAVAPRSYETFTSPVCDLECTIALCVRRDRCPTGAELVTYADAIYGLYADWQAADDEELAAISSAHYNVVGFKAGGGTGPDFNESLGTWDLTLNFTLRGHITEA